MATKRPTLGDEPGVEPGRAFGPAAAPSHVPDTSPPHGMAPLPTRWVKHPLTPVPTYGLTPRPPRARACGHLCGHLKVRACWRAGYPANLQTFQYAQAHAAVPEAVHNHWATRLPTLLDALLAALVAALLAALLRQHLPPHVPTLLARDLQPGLGAAVCARGRPRGGGEGCHPWLPHSGHHFLIIWCPGVRTSVRTGAGAGVCPARFPWPGAPEAGVEPRPGAGSRTASGRGGRRRLGHGHQGVAQHRIITV